MSKLKVMTKKDGFRRAGFTFREQEPTIIDIDTLPEQLRESTVQALKNEPMLIVVEISDGDSVSEAKSDDMALVNKQAELDKALVLIEEQKSQIHALTTDLAEAHKGLAAVKANTAAPPKNNKK